MKILLSAYACEPHKGSEPAVGWNWARSLSGQGHDVHVLTRSNNAPAVDAAVSAQGLRLTPLYYDLPRWCRRMKHWGGNAGMYLYYLAWQIGAYRCAKRAHKTERFDRVQHITFASFRQPSFMGGLGIPFIFGPVGGGETMPPSLRRGLKRGGRLHEVMRNAGNALVKIDPMMHFTFSRAGLIPCTTRETQLRIPRRFQKKCIVQPTIGVDVIQHETAPRRTGAGTRFLFVGRLLYWKGLHLALRALPEVLRACPDARLKVIGAGEDQEWLKSVAQECGVADMVEWIPSVPHGEIAREYGNNTAFVFPSLHDSGGMVVLESLAAGLPVICLNLGGPGVMVDESCGMVIDAAGAMDEAAVERSLAAAMIRLAKDNDLRNKLSAGCLSRAAQLTWERAALHVYAAMGNKSAS